MTVSFSEYLDLLDVHGRAVVASLEQASPDDRMPPLAETARQIAEEHWDTLEIWAWSLENPTRDWEERAEAETPKDYDALVAGLATHVHRSLQALAATGPDTTIDYFGRPGTTADVARLLAHEAIATAHSVSMAAVRPTPSLSPVAASDGIDQSLHHWAHSGTDAVWLPRAVEVRTTDTADAWYLSLSQEADFAESRFRLAEYARPSAVVVEGPAEHVLWWLLGHTSSEGDLAISGDTDMIRAVRAVFMHFDEEKPKRRRWWWFS